MKAAIAVIALALPLIVATTVSAQPSPPPDPNKIQVLIVTGQHVHDWRNTTPILKQILESTGKFEVRINEEFRGAGPETVAPYAAVDHGRCAAEGADRRDAGSEVPVPRRNDGRRRPPAVR
jgi:hypothetical protein